MCTKVPDLFVRGRSRFSCALKGRDVLSKTMRSWKVERVTFQVTASRPHDTFHVKRDTHSRFSTEQAKGSKHHAGYSQPLMPTASRSLLRVRPSISRALRWAELRAAQGARSAAYWTPVRKRRATPCGDADRPSPSANHRLRRQAAISGVAPPRRTTGGTPSSSRLGAGHLAPQRRVREMLGRTLTAAFHEETPVVCLPCRQFVGRLRPEGIRRRPDRAAEVNLRPPR